MFAKGNLRDVWHVEPMHILDYASSILPKSEPYKPQPQANFVEIEEVKSIGFKTADTEEMVLELSVPTADDLDNYFSSIGLRLPEVG